MQFEGSLLYAGSAGLANAFSEIIDGKKHGPPNIKQEQGPVLVVNGSRKIMNQRQIEYLQTQSNAVPIAIDVELIYRDSSGYAARCIAQATPEIRAGRHVVLYPDPRYLRPEPQSALVQEYSDDCRQLELMIRRFLGECVTQLIKQTSPKNMVIRVL